MRVLLFSNRKPTGVNTTKKTAGGSWIDSLEKELMKYSEIELGFVYSELAKEPKQFSLEDSSTVYYMVPRDPFSKFDRWSHRFFCKPPSEKPLSGYMQAVEDFKPDVILFFGTESDFSLIVPNLKIPSVIWFQGNLTVYQRMYESGINIWSTLRFESLKRILMGDTLLHDFYAQKGLVAREKRIFQKGKNFIGRTDWDRRVVSVLAPQANYFHCDEAMRAMFWDHEWKLRKNRQKFVITTTIRSNLYKGLETIIETSHILNELLDIKVEWRVIGVPENVVYVRAAARKAGVSVSTANVKLLGARFGVDMVKELLDSDCYVHPSHIENSPNAVQEAMLLGMPVVATNCGGTPCMLEDKLEGVLVQNKDPFAMAGAILEIIRNPEEAERMGANARKRAIVRNNGEKICSDLLAIFKSIKV